MSAVFERVRRCVAQLLLLDGSAWLFSFSCGRDEDVIASVAWRERQRALSLANRQGEGEGEGEGVGEGEGEGYAAGAAVAASARAAAVGVASGSASGRERQQEQQQLLQPHGVQCVAGGGASPSQAQAQCEWGCGPRCLAGPELSGALLLVFGVWCIHRVLELSQRESRPELWGKYTYVLNRLQVSCVANTPTCSTGCRLGAACIKRWAPESAAGTCPSLPCRCRATGTTVRYTRARPTARTLCTGCFLRTALYIPHVICSATLSPIPCSPPLPPFASTQSSPQPSSPSPAFPGHY